MQRAHQVRRRVGILSTFLLSLVGAACSGGSADPESAGHATGGVGIADASIRRLEFSYASRGNQAAEASVLARLEVKGGQGPWEEFASERKRTMKRPVQGKDVTELQELRVLQARREEKSIRAAIPEAARGFSQVIAELSAENGPFEEIHMEFLKGTQLLHATPKTRLSTGQVLRPMVFSAEALRTIDEEPDTFRLVFEGYSRLSMISSVSFVALPGPQMTSQMEGVGEPRQAGDVTRRATAVTTTEVSSARVELDEGEAVSGFVAVDPRFARADERLTFSLALVSDGPLDSKGQGEPVATRSVSLSVSDGWEPVELRPAGDAPGAYQLRVTVDSDQPFGAGFGLFAEARVTAPATGQEGALVLLITSDTHRGDHLGIVNADSPVQTPHLDALARRGVLFEDCFSQTNVTNPSHIALLTGKHPRDTGILNNRTRLASRAATLAEAFAEQGYRTLAVTSAFHLLDQRSGLGQGFDRMEGPDVHYRDGEVSIRRLMTWLRESPEVPTFAWLHLFDAHGPYAPPKPYDRRYYDGDDPFAGPEPELDARVRFGDLTGLKDLSYPYAQYRAEVDYLDGALGALLREPRVQSGVVAFTADHAESFGRHGIWWSHAGLYPDTVHIPMIVAWPEAPAGTRVAAPVQQIDLGRTLLNLSGHEDVPFEGRDLRWAIDEPEATSPRFLVAAHGISASIEVDGWQLVLELRPNFPDSNEDRREFGEASLFYRPNDPYCEKDLLQDELERAAMLRTRLIEWLNEPRPAGLGVDGTTTAQDARMLAALGYAGDDEAVSTVRLWDPERWDKRGEWTASVWRKMFEGE